MKKYYIDLDIRLNKIFIAPTIQSEEKYLIIFESRYLADNFIRKLEAKLIAPPTENIDLYNLIDTIPNVNISLYTPKTD